MDELINLVCQKAGINPDQARAAVETVIEQLKGKLGEPLASQLEAALQGGGASASSAAASGEGVLNKIGGMLGGSGGSGS